MDFPELMGGFALLVGGALIGVMFKTRGGQVALAILCAAMGLLGLGYFVGYYSAGHRYHDLLWGLREKPYAIDDPAKLRDLIDALTSFDLRPELPFWVFLVSGLFMAGGFLAGMTLVGDYSLQIARRDLQAKRKTGYAPQEKPEEGASGDQGS